MASTGFRNLPPQSKQQRRPDQPDRGQFLGGHGSGPGWWRRGPSPRLLMICGLLTGLLTGCQGQRVQSALHPGSPAAAAVAQLWWVLLAILGIYSAAVFVLMLVAIFRRPTSSRPPHEGRVFILVGGVFLPSMILVPLLIYSVSTTRELRMRDTGLTVRVVGHRWWWHVEYPEQGIVTANEIHIPAGEPVRLELSSAHVIHSFWVPELHGKMDMLPGQTTSFWIQADRPGTFRGQCAEFCGVQHARMAFVVRALPPDEFVQWASGRRQPPRSAPVQAGVSPSAASPPADAGAELSQIVRGQQAFFRHGCAVCHAIEGTPAVGRVGPDLTWMGDRQTIGAATLPNTPSNLLAWITDPRVIKPGVNMPATHADADELRSMVAYLQSLTHQGRQE